MLIPKLHIIENVFMEEERKDFLEKSKPFLADSRKFINTEGFYWFKLTSPSMNLVPSLRVYHEHLLKLIKKEIGLNLAIMGAWMNLTDGRRKEIKWHTHPVDYAGVYYMKTTPFFNSGTVIKEYGLVRSPQNSLLIFPGNLYHSTPGFPFRFKRYTYAFNLNIVT